MRDMIGRTISISGMAIEIISDDAERWKCRNITTQEALFIDKSVIEKAIKLGKAEVVSSQDERP